MINEIKKNKETIVFGDDSVVIVKHLADLPGGRTLDLTGYTGEVIKAGTVIVRDKKGHYKPLPVVDGAYRALATEGEDAAKVTTETYVGLLYRTILAKDPQASILIEGVVNKALLPAPLPAGFPSSIIAIEDEVA